jgi:hypothetical protein
MRQLQYHYPRPEFLGICQDSGPLALVCSWPIHHLDGQELPERPLRAENALLPDCRLDIEPLDKTDVYQSPAVHCASTIAKAHFNWPKCIHRRAPCDTYIIWLHKHSCIGVHFKYFSDYETSLAPQCLQTSHLYTARVGPLYSGVQ